MLCFSVEGGGGVETGPEHPEEDGSDHGKEIRGVSGALLVVVGHAGCVHGAGDGQTKVGAERVHEDRVSRVHSLNAVSEGEDEAIK